MERREDVGEVLRMSVEREIEFYRYNCSCGFANGKYEIVGIRREWVASPSLFLSRDRAIAAMAEHVLGRRNDPLYPVDHHAQLTTESFSYTDVTP